MTLYKIIYKIFMIWNFITIFVKRLAVIIQTQTSTKELHY